MSSKIGRNAGTGRFTTEQQAQRYPTTHVVEPRTSGTQGQTGKIGRNAETGLFTTVQEARTKPLTHIVETIKR